MKQRDIEYYRNICVKIASISLMYHLNILPAGEALDKIAEVYAKANEEDLKDAAQQDAKPTSPDVAERVAGDGQDGSTGSAGERGLENPAS